jgi:hypothetical protein
MAVSLPNGSTVFIGSAYGSALTVTVATNANPCVMTSTAHGLSNGDYVVVTSGWSRLNNKLVRVAGVTANTFELEGYDTTSTSIYPATSGIGSVREVTTFTQISQILQSTSDGGEQQFLEYQFLESDAKTKIPTSKTAGGWTLSIGDDPTLAGYVALSTANDDRLPRACRINLASGSKLCYYGYCSLNKTPTLTVDELMACEATVSFLNEVVRYTT